MPESITPKQTEMGIAELSAERVRLQSLLENLYCCNAYGKSIDELTAVEVRCSTARRDLNRVTTKIYNWEHDTAIEESKND